MDYILEFNFIQFSIVIISKSCEPTCSIIYYVFLTYMYTTVEMFSLKQ